MWLEEVELIGHCGFTGAQRMERDPPRKRRSVAFRVDKPPFTIGEVHGGDMSVCVNVAFIVCAREGRQNIVEVCVRRVCRDLYPLFAFSYVREGAVRGRGMC